MPRLYRVTIETNKDYAGLTPDDFESIKEFNAFDPVEDDEELNSRRIKLISLFKVVDFDGNPVGEPVSVLVLEEGKIEGHPYQKLIDAFEHPSEAVNKAKLHLQLP